MKRFQTYPAIIGITLLLISSSFSVLAQKSYTALSYLEYMNNEHRKIGENMWNYTRAVVNGKNARRIEAKRNDLIQTTLKAKENIAKMSGFEGNTELRDSMVSYLNLSYLVLSEDYSKIVDLEEIAEQSYDLMEAYMTAQEKANDKMESAGYMVEMQFKNFANSNNIKLVENQDKLSKKLAVSSAVFKYYNIIYLIYFKNFKQEAYFLNALEKNDINGMEQNKNTLAQYAKDGIKTLDTMKHYKNDLSLKTACKQMLDFYIQEANVKAPILIDFFMKKEKFEKIKSSFEAINPNDRTRDDINNYNKAISDFNNTLKQYNTINQDIFNRRNTLINNWNNTTQSFLNRHIPAN